MSIYRFLASSDAAAARARGIRRSFPIHFYGGRNGSGKSLAMLYDTIPDLELGRQVLSTVRIVDYKNPRPCDDDRCPAQDHGAPGHLAAHPSWVHFRGWDQLLAFRGGVILMDEITGVADSADGSLPGPVRKKLQELRRDECQLRLTGLAWMNVHKRIRQSVRAVTRCESQFPVTVKDSDGHELVWRPRRLATWRTYDSQSLPTDDHTDNAYENADLLAKSRFWIPGSDAAAVYDTRAPVTTVGEIDDTGLCVCGGHRSRLPCTCPDYVEKKEAARPARKARSAEDSPRGLRSPGNGAAVRVRS